MPKPDQWRRKQRPYSQRLVAVRELRPRFLIVCEGKKTEPNYFRSFRVPTQIAEIDIQGLGYNTVSLVNAAIKCKDSCDYDQIWCVFDKDSFQLELFNSAIQKASAHGIHVAYSNEAFELWYVLHFDYLNTAVSRAQYIDILASKLGYAYEKNSTSMYSILEKHLPTAITNASNLLASYDPHDPGNDCPCTTVHLLVKELLKFSV